MRMNSTRRRLDTWLGDELARSSFLGYAKPLREVLWRELHCVMTILDQSDDGSFLGCWTGISAWQQRISPVPALVHRTIVPHVSH